MKLFRTIFGLSIAAAFLVGCQKEDGTGRLIVKMTDDPADYLEVNVEVEAVQIHHKNDDSEGWMNLNTNTGIYNLLDLQNDASVVIADQDDIPVGDLQQMRLILGDNNTLVATHGTYPLALSGQDKTGLKINLDTEMKDDKDLEILLDFDAGQSVVEQGNGEYRLKPVVKIETINYID